MTRLTRSALALMLAAAQPLAAQGIETETLDPSDVPQLQLTPAPEVARRVPATTDEQGVVLRALDKVSGEVVDFTLEPGQTKQLGYIQVTLGECRYPTDNPAGDAFAFLAIRDAGDPEPRFSGWMIASSPALNALDHPRYDVWPLRCRTAEGD